jgi:hypothetical protein
MKGWGEFVSWLCNNAILERYVRAREEVGMPTHRLLFALAFAAVTLLPSTASAQNPPAGTVIASAQYSADPDLRCDLLEVKRLSGGALIIRWRVVNTAGQEGGLTATKPKTIPYDFGWGELYYIDPAENKKYQFLTDSAGGRILDVFYGDYSAGQQRLNWAKFPAPPPSSTKISIALPRFAPFEDVPLAPMAP